MTIKILPQHIINKLKAWEIVERPASIIKELIENSLDAWAQNIIIHIQEGGKKFISVEDDWSWIDTKDMTLTVERYATSKIFSEEDMSAIQTFGFRWEALASISEVSNFEIQSKTKDNKVADRLTKVDWVVHVSNVAFHKEHWTIVYIKNLFYNTPARLKFLKSDATEWKYCYDTIFDILLVNYTIWFTILKDNKQYLKLEPTDNLFDRVLKLYKKERQNKLFAMEYAWEYVQAFWLVSHSSLSFSSPDNIKIFVNKRPVKDKIIKKAVIDAYQRQLHPWEYPLALLFIEIVSDQVDVNVHPRKLEVKFLDPGSMYNFTIQGISRTLGENKISNESWNSLLQQTQEEIRTTQLPAQDYQSNAYLKSSFTGNLHKDFSDSGQRNSFSSTPLPLESSPQFFERKYITAAQETSHGYKIIGQLFDTYIILEDQGNMYMFDQHALAERIAFEKLKKDSKTKKLVPEILLQPLSMPLSSSVDIAEFIENISKLGFDVSQIGENKIVVYAVPKIFTEYRLDIEKLFDSMTWSSDITLDSVLDNIFATKACKASIKAGQKLSSFEIAQLIKDGFDNIDWMFVCQHWRPFFVQIDRLTIEKMFDRK